MAENVTQMSAADVVADLTDVLDGHTVADYFSDSSAVAYEVPATGDLRSTRIEVVAEDNEGNQKRFIIDVREA